MPSVTGMDSAAAALRFWERKQEVVANNLANTSTDGFKAERVFATLLDGATPTARTTTDLSAGTLRQTGSNSDIAMEGPGFFVVSTADGERFTRGGSWRLDAQNHLVDGDGHEVLGIKGPITLAAGPYDIDQTGQVTQNGAVVDRLRVENAAPGTQLVHQAGGLFVPPGAPVAVPPASRSVRQGSIESSNVSSIGSLVDMISIQRAYGAVQKAIVDLDSVHGTAVTQLAKPAS